MDTAPGVYLISTDGYWAKLSASDQLAAIDGREVTLDGKLDDWIDAPTPVSSRTHRPIIKIEVHPLRGRGNLDAILNAADVYVAKVALRLEPLQDALDVHRSAVAFRCAQQ
jgi:hypothetical protein